VILNTPALAALIEAQGFTHLAHRYVNLAIFPSYCGEFILVKSYFPLFDYS
jgi:hypothetical protein